MGRTTRRLRRPDKAVAAVDSSPSLAAVAALVPVPEAIATAATVIATPRRRRRLRRRLAAAAAVAWSSRTNGQCHRGGSRDADNVCRYGRPFMSAFNIRSALVCGDIVELQRVIGTRRVRE